MNLQKRFLALILAPAMVATSTPFPSVGQNLSQDLSKPMDQRQAAYLTAYTRSHDEATYKIAYIAETAAAIEHTIKVDRQFRNSPTAAARYRDEAMKSTQEFVNGVDF